MAASLFLPANDEQVPDSALRTLRERLKIKDDLLARCGMRFSECFQIPTPPSSAGARLEADRVIGQIIPVASEIPRSVR